MAEERKRSFFGRLFGSDERRDLAPEPEPDGPAPPEGADQSGPEPSSASAQDAHAPPQAGLEPLPETGAQPVPGFRMSDGTVVPEIRPAPDDEAIEQELAAALPDLLEQLRTEAVVTPPPLAPAPSTDAAPVRSWWDRLRTGLLTLGAAAYFRNYRGFHETTARPGEPRRPGGPASPGRPRRRHGCPHHRRLGTRKAGQGHHPGRGARGPCA
jgi:hypothetical protein